MDAGAGVIERRANSISMRTWAGKACQSVKPKRVKTGGRKLTWLRESLELRDVWVFLGSSLAFLAVALGAFGAHALEGRLDADALRTYDTAARYQMVHALAILLAAPRRRGRGSAGACLCFLLGTALFSGSLYALAGTGARWLGAVTPFGGGAFLIGWAILAASGLRRRGLERRG
jgi:uncharacterized membrane protein YgdD (TMEM256/DUF423 family)